MISDERLENIVIGDAAFLEHEEIAEMAKDLLALRKAFSEPYGYTDKDAYGMVYEPRHKDRLRSPTPVYRKPKVEEF